jgi:APA family basic amino acid/polyamine antiporter
MMESDPLNADPRDRLGRTLSLTDATMLVVSSVIGSGIFLTPGMVADLLPDVKVFLAAWVVGGVLSLAGAIANAELGTLFPHAGGDYVYLREAFHPAAGFLVGWLTFFVIYAGTVATLAAAFAEAVSYFTVLDPSAKLLLAIAVTMAFSAINYVGVRWGARFNNVTGFLKLAAILLFAGGAVFGARQALSVTSHVSAIGPSAFGLALSPILFTYLGWNAPVYVASEMERPSRNLPIALFLGLGVCTALYLAVNVAYLHAIPIDKLRGEGNAGQAAATALFGPRGGFWLALFVLVSIAGSLNAMILVGPRIAYAMALDGLFVSGADRVHPRYRTPHRAIVIQAAVAVGLILMLKTYPSILDYTTFAIVLATMADTAALYTLRRTHPHSPRPYRAWGYPCVPAVYLAANAGIALAMILGRSTECALGVLMLLLGLPFYWVLSFRRRRPRREAQ